MLEIKKTYNGDIKRGDIFWYATNHTICPVLVIQNDIGNAHSPKTIVVRLGSSNAIQEKANKIPTIVLVHKTEILDKDTMHSKCFDELGYILTSEILTVEKFDLKDKIGVLNSKCFERVDDALKISLGLKEKFQQYN